MTSPTTNDAYYVRTGDATFRCTEHAVGAWGPAEQHMGPVSGLMVDAIERCKPRPDLLLARVCFDIFGVIGLGEVAVSVRMVRPGRTIELLVAELTADDRTLVRASAWRLARTDTTDLAGSEAVPIPGPSEGEAFKPSDLWPGGFIRSLDCQVIPGWRPGRAQVWLRSKVGLVAGEHAGPMATYFALIDTANGIAVRTDPSTVAFPNTDLTVHLLRQPDGPWVGLDTAVSFGAEGVGLTATTLHDLHGPLGRAEQILTIRHR